MGRDDMPDVSVRSNRPSLSVVIEWENARLAEAQRSLRMLAALAEQLDEEVSGSSRQVEILVLHNPAVVDGRAIETMIESVRPRAAWPARLRLQASGECGYYEQKNFGVQHSSGEIVLFVDSDVVPEPGWLRRLLGALDDPAVGLVCGSTHVELEGFYARAVALFWLFPLRPAHDGLEEARSFYANNVAFRRDLIEANLFPEADTFRGQCRELSRALQRQGVRVVRHAGARVSHPPPNGFRHFVNRAMSQGYDEGLKDRLQGHGLRRRLGKSFRDFGRRMRDATRRIAEGYRKVGLSPVGAVGAWLLALSYYLLRLTGRVLTAANPRIVPRYFALG